MEKEFVSYELALKLKELGFDEECFGWWSWINGITASLYTYPMKNSDMASHYMHPNNASAPLWQQAFDWFRETNGLFAEFSVDTLKNKYDWCIPVNIDRGYCSEKEYDTYQEAKEECLKKLIELSVNRDKNSI